VTATAPRVKEDTLIIGKDVSMKSGNLFEIGEQVFGFRNELHFSSIVAITVDNALT